MNVGEPDIFLSTQAVDSLTPDARLSDLSSDELQESITSLFGGISGLLFVLSFIFFLQAPLASGGIILVLAAGWGGHAVYQERHRQQS